MILEGYYACQCGKTYPWKYCQLENSMAIFRVEDWTKNVLNINETSDFYTIMIQCPYCGKRNHIEYKK